MGNPWVDTSRGFMTGETFDFQPEPPARDTLGTPLAVPKVPLNNRPNEVWQSRMKRFLVRNGMAAGSPADKMRWKLYDAIASVLIAIGAVSPESGGHPPTKKLKIYHPCDLKFAFDLVVSAPESLNREARYLELILGYVIKAYTDAMGTINKSAFLFEAEAREYFQAGYRAERLLKEMKEGVEAFNATQQAYTAYFHGRNYYLFSLVRREKRTAGTQLFSYYYRACHFIARVGWDGELLPKPNLRNLPNRATLLFHIQRDASVLDRFRSDRAFSDQMAAILKSLPS